MLSLFLDSVGLNLWLRSDDLWELLVVVDDGVLIDGTLASSLLGCSLNLLLLQMFLHPFALVAQLTTSIDVVLESMLMLLKEVEIAG